MLCYSLNVQQTNRQGIYSRYTLFHGIGLTFNRDSFHIEKQQNIKKVIKHQSFRKNVIKYRNLVQNIARYIYIQVY